MVGHGHFLARCARDGIEPKLDLSSRAFKLFNFERPSPSLRKTMIKLPIDNNSRFQCESDAADVDLPVIFGLGSMKKRGWKVGEVRSSLEHVGAKRKMQLMRRGHLWREWPNNEMLFTASDSMKLHRRFGHPSSSKSHNLLKKAKHEEVDDKMRKARSEIASKCEPCQRIPQKPFGFQASMPGDMQFNHEIIADLFCSDKKPALRAVGRGAHFSAAKFLQGESAIHVWNALIEYWISAYVGFPNALSHDQGSALTSKLFKIATSHIKML